MSETATGPFPADVEPVDVEPVNRAERRSLDRARSAAMARCLDHGRSAVKRSLDPAITAEDIASRLYLSCATTGDVPTLTAARNMVASINVEYSGRTAREVKVIAGEGNRNGRARRVSRSVAYIHARQVTRGIVDHGPALTSPVDGPGYGFRSVLESGPYWFRKEPVPVVLPPMLARMPRGPRSTILDRARYLSVQPGTWSGPSGPWSRPYGPAIPVGPATFGPAVKFATVVQAILADGPMTRPDVDTARWSTGDRFRQERETTVAVPRFPNRDVEPVTAETTARHQIHHGADKGPVRLQREPRLTRLLDKRNLYATRVTNDRELSADISRDMRPDVDGVYYRNLLLGFLTYRPVTGGRGTLETLSRALQASRTTVGLLAVDHVRADGSAARNGKGRAITRPGTNRFYPSAALRALNLSTGSTMATALDVLIQDACRYAERVADNLSLPVTARHGFSTSGPARPGPATTGPVTGNRPVRPFGPVGMILSADRFNRYAANNNVPLPTVEPARPARKPSSYRPRHVELIDRTAGARSAEWFRFWSTYGPAESVDLSSPAASDWFRSWFTSGRKDIPRNVGSLPAGFFPLEPVTGPVVSPAVVEVLDVPAGPVEPADVERAARTLDASRPVVRADVRGQFRAGFDHGRDSARAGNWSDVQRYRGPVPRLPEGSGPYVPYVGWII